MGKLPLDLHPTPTCVRKHDVNPSLQVFTMGNLVSNSECSVPNKAPIAALVNRVFEHVSHCWTMIEKQRLWQTRPLALGS